MYSFPGGTLLCTALNGCATLTDRLPPPAIGVLYLIFVTFVIFLLTRIHRWRDVLSVVSAVTLVNLFFYLRQNTWPQPLANAVYPMFASMVFVMLWLGFSRIVKQKYTNFPPYGVFIIAVLIPSILTGILWRGGA
ncbi:hypothetical protein [Rahnella aceris]